MIPVIIPYYQQVAQLQQCLHSLRIQTVPVEIFVRDNSQDNVYFTAAVNEGLRRYLENILVKYLIILNQDMYLFPEAVEVLCQFMEQHPRCGIAVPLQLHHQYPDYVICAGGLQAVPVGQHIQGPLSEFGEDRELVWGNGACMLLRKKMVQDIGLLDGNFKFIGSDSDYCFTARSRGWQVWCVAKAKGIHEVGQSAQRSDEGLEQVKWQDMRYFVKKWLSGRLYQQLAFEGEAWSAEKVAEMERLFQVDLS